MNGDEWVLLAPDKATAASAVGTVTVPAALPSVSTWNFGELPHSTNATFVPSKLRTGDVQMGPLPTRNAHFTVASPEPQMPGAGCDPLYKLFNPTRFAWVLDG